MYEIYLHPTTIRHNNIVSSLFANVFNEFISGNIHVMQEQIALTHWGTKMQIDCKTFKLVDVEKLGMTKEGFTDGIIDELGYIQPDFFLFSSNPFLVNKAETKVAGIPNLIVEVWSKSNTDEDKHIKQKLYSTGCEHWYISQNSNIVKCMFGVEELPDKYLKEILKTVDGIEFDLRFLVKN